MELQEKEEKGRLRADIGAFMDSLKTLRRSCRRVHKESEEELTAHQKVKSLLCKDLKNTTSGEKYNDSAIGTFCGLIRRK